MRILRAFLKDLQYRAAYFLLRMLKYEPGKIYERGGRKYIVDWCGAWRRVKE